MSSRTPTVGPTSSKRPSAISSVPAVKPSCKIHPTAVVADKAQLVGPHLVEIGENAIIHPYAKIRAEHGNVIIGRNCIVAERAVVGPPEEGGEAGCVLGDGVSIETGAVVEARRVGDYSVVEVKAKLGRGCVVGNWCKVGALCTIEEIEVLENFTVLFGEGARRVDRTTKDKPEARETKRKGREKEIELLKGLIVDSKTKWLE